MWCKNMLDYAIDNKFDYAIMIHGDGQYAREIPNFISKFKR